jgi:hypothetical protein
MSGSRASSDETVRRIGGNGGTVQGPDEHDREQQPHLNLASVNARFLKGVPATSWIARG